MHSSWAQDGRNGTERDGGEAAASIGRRHAEWKHCMKPLSCSFTRMFTVYRGVWRKLWLEMNALFYRKEGPRQVEDAHVRF